MKLFIFIYFFFLTLLSFGQNNSYRDLSNSDKLNSYLIDEVNRIRKKAKVDSLQVSTALEEAASDQSMYMMRKGKITHYQKGNRIKYSPKNRADFHESGFEIIGENVQQLHVSQVSEELKKNRRIDDPYHALAKLLAENWRKSPPHYANMINPNYIYTITTIEIDKEGNIYACQLFGGSQYIENYEKDSKPVKYKPVKEKKCKRNNTQGVVEVDEYGNILFVADSKKESGFRWALPWTEGIAADIVLKSQYECNKLNNFNPEPGVKGIPLNPVYKKDFRKIGVWKKNKVTVPLGKVPDYIDQPYEVNLTIISRKRTCGNIFFPKIVSSIDIGINLNLEIPKRSPYNVESTDSIILKKVYFEKSDASFSDSISLTYPKNMKEFHLDSTVLVGYASIEGDFEKNKNLFEQRTKNVKKVLIEEGFTDSLIHEISKENFTDFREDIKNTQYESWLNLNDKELKEVVSKHSSSDSLEQILAEHRYVQVKHYFNKKDSTLYSIDDLKKDFLDAIKLSKKNDAEEALLKLFQLKKLNNSDLLKNLYDSIPRNRRFADIKYYFDLYRFTVLEKQDFVKAATEFIDSLEIILELDSKNRKAHSALAFFESMKVSQQGDPQLIREQFYKISESRRIERELQARILLELAVTNDLIVYYNNLEQPYLISEVSNYIRKVKPTVSEIFGISAYYNFFEYTKYAFDLVKRVYLKTEDPGELQYFLNLVLFSNIDLSESQKLRYFTNLANHSTAQFCSFFKDGSVSFQIFDNLNYKAVYCELCKEDD